MQLSFFDVPAVPVQENLLPPAKAVIHNGTNGTGHKGNSPTVLASLDNFRITAADPVGGGGQMAKIRANIEAIELLKRLQAEGRQATPTEQARLVLYTGWGHSGNLFHPQPTGKWVTLQNEVRPLFTDEQWRAASASTTNAHYTSPEVIRWIWEMVEHLGFAGGKVLEPAAGVGHFIGLMPTNIWYKSKLWACELDLLSGAIVKQLYPAAKVNIGPFEAAPYEPDYFDLVISNVPFSDIRVNDPAIYNNGRGHLADTGLHNYFFIKALDLVRPGGLVIFITSRFTMDSQEKKIRQYLTEKAELLGAVRLPVTAFRKNALTEVTTDILFLRKGGEGLSEVPENDWLQLHDMGHYNMFYNSWPSLMMGEMQQIGGRFKDAWECVPPDNFNLAGALDNLLTRPADERVFPRGIYTPAPLQTRSLRRIEPEIFENPPRQPWLKNGSYAVDDYYRVWELGGGKWSRARLEGKQLSQVRGLVEVRDSFYGVVRANVQSYNDSALAAAQAELATVYRRYIAKFGYLHETSNINAFSDDPDADNILALERWDPDLGKATKAAIFTRRLVTDNARPDKADSASDALIISLRETRGVDLERMAELTDKTQAELVEELADAGEIFLDPATGRWTTADEYLSGNIREKIAIAEQTDLKGHVLALREILPADMGPKEIFVQLGVPWIPADVVNDFFNEHLFNTWIGSGVGWLEVDYLEALGYWKIDDTHFGMLKNSAANTRTWGTNRVRGKKLLEKCLNNQMATVYDMVQGPDGKPKRRINQEATLVARAKQAEIKAEFDKWLWVDSGRAERLVRIFNDRFNSTVPRKWNGEHLDFPGMNPEIAAKLRPIQRDVIWRGLQSKSLLIGHQVGFGKTYSLLGLAMRLKQMGLRRRIVIVVKRATFGQFVASAHEVYPFANILAISSGQTARQRRRQLARITTDDFDFIITTHPVFAKIPLKVETKLEFLREQLHQIALAMLQSSNRKSNKELENARKRIEGKIERAIESGMVRDPNTLYFEDLGIDAILADESGVYKNLWFHTTMTRVSGIGGTEAGRAFDMFMKVRQLQQRHGFVAFASGTPVENSISEVFCMMSFLIPHELIRLGLHHFDAWAATFGQIVVAVEMKPDGSGFRMMARFAQFNNLPQLKRLWLMVADIQMDAERAGIKLPDLVNGKPIGIEAKPYPELKEIIKTLANRANNLGDKDASEDNILVIINHADKASLDARLLGRFAVIGADGEPTGEYIHITEDYSGSKVNLCADKVAEIYHQTSGIEIPGVPGKHNLAQLIFLDSSVPRKRDKELLEAESGAFLTVYNDLRQKLIARGVKASEIAYAQDWNTDEKKERLAAALNAGRIRVTIGSTEVMGIGLNCQRVLVAEHHLDCPWKPAWLEQREGRIKRQGNLCPEVAIYRYVMEGSFDVYRWQTVWRKWLFIVVFNSTDLTTLTVEDPGMAVLSAQEMTALATGNPKIKQRVELQTRLRTLMALRREFEEARFSSHRREEHTLADQAEWQARLKRLTTIQTAVQAEGLEVAEKLGAQLYELSQPYCETYDERIALGELYGIPVCYEGHIVEERTVVQAQDVRAFWTGGEEAAQSAAPTKKEIRVQRKIIVARDDFNVSFHLRIVEESRVEKNAAALVNVFKVDLLDKIGAVQNDLTRFARTLAEVEKVLAVPFTHDPEIQGIQEKLLFLDVEINTELGDGRAEERQAAREDLDRRDDDNEGDDDNEIEVEVD